MPLEFFRGTENWALGRGPGGLDWREGRLLLPPGGVLRMITTKFTWTRQYSSPCVAGIATWLNQRGSGYLRMTTLTDTMESWRL